MRLITQGENAYILKSLKIPLCDSSLSLRENAEYVQRITLLRCEPCFSTMTASHTKYTYNGACVASGVKKQEDQKERTLSGHHHRPADHPALEKIQNVRGADGALCSDEHCAAKIEAPAGLVHKRSELLLCYCNR